MKKSLRILSAVLALALLGSSAWLTACSPSTPDSPGDTPTAEPTAEPTKKEETFPMFDLTALHQTGTDSQRWLSIPLSRLVINPYEFNSPTTMTHAAYSDRATMPLNIGYLDPYSTSGTGVWLEDLLTVYEYSNGESAAEMIWEAYTDETEGWIVQNPGKMTFEADGDALSVTVMKTANEPWQYVGRRVNIDLDAHPILTLSVTACAGTWALKICEDGKEDEVLNGDTSKTGLFSYDLAAILGRGGTFKGVVKLYAVGYEKTLSFDRMDLQYIQSGCNESTEREITWTPAALESCATYPEGMQISVTDAFADANTVVRTIRAQKDGSLIVVGKLPGGGTFADNTLTFLGTNGKYQAAITSDRTLTPQYYGDLLALLGNGEEYKSPARAEYYALKFENLHEGDTVTLAVSIQSDAATKADIVRAAKTAAVTNGGELAEKTWETYWSEILSRVPTPQSFSLGDIPTMDVSEESIRQMYYIAWVFTLQNTLPANPELNYPYPQAACGKPSMWAYGDSQSAYSASWESFYGIQLLGYVMPDVAWSALQGLISLVDEEGMLGGESLPSVKAHTAWILYQLTGDSEKLASVYDGIARYLDWRMENPRWIYLEHNDVNSADADFVVSALTDIEYMEKICDILGKTTEKTEWETKHAAFMKKYYEWNFKDGQVYQYCNKVSMARSGGCRIWCTKGLLVDGLDNIHENILLTAFSKEYNTSGSFAGFSGIKYPEVTDTVLGLEKVKKYRYAREFAACCVRDIVRVGMLAENYTNYPDPEPTGVRPAMFGTAMMIDCVLMLNGFSYRKVDSVAFTSVGGVDRVLVRGEYLSFKGGSNAQE